MIGEKTVEPVFLNRAVKKLVKHLKPYWALRHALSLMNWDLQTYMPLSGIADRCRAREEIESIIHRILRSSRTRSLLNEAKSRQDSLNVYERGLVRIVEREVRIAESLPEELVRKRARLSAKATIVWRQARERNDFSVFSSYLAQIINVARKVSERLGYEEHPYDALLDLYEEGLKVRDLEAMFSVLVPEIRRILRSVERRGFYPSSHPLERELYDRNGANQLVKKLLDKLGWPWDRGRVDESPHPFTMSMGINDVRITVRYEGRNIKKLIYALLHEYGHALYELQQDPRLKMTPLSTGVSLGVHESQSRFWENIVGRSPWFTRLVKQLADDTLKITSSIDYRDFYIYVNTVKPGPIRVDADEITYNLHIYLRFVLEKELIEGTLNVNELPQAWNELSQKLLGVTPSNHAEGVLQDIHWSLGDLGYFPAYTIGDIIASMILFKITQGKPENMGEMSIEDLKLWLRDNIHRWGRVYEPRKLVMRSLGEDLNAKKLIDYLEWKYIKLPNEIDSLIN